MSYYLLNQHLVFNGQTGQLSCQETGHNTQLRSNEWKLLQLFLRHPGEDLSGDFILQQVWDRQRARSSVPTAIKNLRRQLGDLADSPRFIQTQIMSGYAFIATSKELTLAQYEAMKGADLTLSGKLMKHLRQHRTRVILYSVNLCSVAALVYAGSSLYQMGALDNWSGNQPQASYLPMFIDGMDINSQDICLSLLLEAQQNSSLTLLPNNEEQKPSQYPDLVWKSPEQEALLCRLPSIK